MFGFLEKAFAGVVDQVQTYLPVVAQEAWNASKAISSFTYQGVTCYGPPVASAAWSASKAAAKFSFDQVTTYGPPLASAAFNASKVAAQVSYDQVTTYGPPAMHATWDMSKVAIGAAAQVAKQVVDAVTAGAESMLHPVAPSKGALVEWQSGAPADASADEWLLVDVVQTIDTANAFVLLDNDGAGTKYVGECEDDYDFSSVSFTGCASAANWHLHALTAV